MLDDEKEDHERRAFDKIMSIEVPLSPDAKTLHDMNIRMEVMSNFVARRKLEKQQAQIRAAAVLQEKKSQLKNIAQSEMPKKPITFDIPVDIPVATPPKLNLSGQLKPPTQLSTILTKPPVPRTNIRNSTAAQKTIIKPSYTIPAPEVPSLRPPALKVTDKKSSSTQRDRILRALQFSIFPNAVDKNKLEKTRKTVEMSAAKKLMFLFRDHKLQYRGLYSLNQQSGEVEKISGMGPSKCDVSQVNLMFKYEDSRKTFIIMQSKTFSNVIDGFTIHDSYWHKTRNTLNSTTSSLSQLSI